MYSLKGSISPRPLITLQMAKFALILRLYGNRLLRVFETKREDVAGDWRRLHKEELHNLYMSAYVVRAIKSSISANSMSSHCS
jgi:hypothetical protein